jgi:hypothetical protein
VDTGLGMPLRQGTSPEVHLRRIREVRLAAYLRVALTYMLISMPHGTSTIFGAFQAILALLLNADELPPSLLNYRVMKSSPVKSFVMKTTRVCCSAIAAGEWAC